MEPPPPFYLSLAGSPEPARASRLAFASPLVGSPDDFPPLEDAEEAAAELIENLQVRTPDQGLRAVVCGETTLAALSVTLGSAALDVPCELRDTWQSAIWINGLWPSSFSLLSCNGVATGPLQATECSQDSSKESVEDYVCAPEEVRVREALALLDGQGAVRPWTAQADPRTPAGGARRASKRPRESSQSPVGGPLGRPAIPDEPPHPRSISADRRSGETARRALPTECPDSSPRQDAALASACDGRTALEKALAEAAPSQGLVEPGEGQSIGQWWGAARLAADGGAFFQTEKTTACDLARAASSFDLARAASSFDLDRAASSFDLDRAASLPRRLHKTARRGRRSSRCASAPPDFPAEDSATATTRPAPDVLPASVETGADAGGDLLAAPEARQWVQEAEIASVVAPDAPTCVQRAQIPSSSIPRPFRAACSFEPLVPARLGNGQPRPCRLLAGLTFLVTCVRDASWRAAVEEEVRAHGGRLLQVLPSPLRGPRGRGRGRAAKRSCLAATRGIPTTVVLAPRLARTLKAAFAVMAGVPIARLSWLTRCLQSQRVTPPGGRDLLWKPGSAELPRPLLRKVVDVRGRDRQATELRTLVRWAGGGFVQGPQSGADLVVVPAEKALSTRGARTSTVCTRKDLVSVLLAEYAI